MAVSRRQFIGLCGLAGVAGFSPISSAQALIRPVRSLHLLNLHTGERVNTVYWEEGRYLPEGLARINRVLRDHRSGETHPMDTDLLDQMVLLGGLLESEQPIEVISAYRSPSTNRALRKASTQVAKNSFHTLGKAIDIRLPGCSIKTLYQASLSLRCGGVGYYPSSRFVHLDTGDRRTWSGR